MKNLLIYVNPEKKFVGETGTLAKIQIDNSLELGWNPNDILLVTNFPYEYQGIKAKVIDLESYHGTHYQATKITTLNKLFDLDFFQDGLYWLHDFDAYQLAPITEKELDMDNFELGLTTYGWLWYWCLGSLFFRSTAAPIFDKTIEIMNVHKVEDEKAIRALTRLNPDNIKATIKPLNITYNFGMRHIDTNFAKATKPIKVIHFHPWYKGDVNTLDVFMHGKNELNKPLMTPRLIKIFNMYGIK